ncbi:hypothetical protein Fmac_013809 [Flemingia macrophylla]|uniref:Uncharacterized protein n=1 Tax=Flemingia macrophylla TaxID=520843 RepID=A0ABD1MA14_9FABA
MNRGKAIAPNSSIGVREFTKWTDEMDFRLPSAMFDEARLGNRVDAKWRVNLIRYYDLMEELWGADRATGHMARTERQTRRNISPFTFTVDLNDDVNNIPEDQPIDAGFHTAYRSPPHVDSYSPSDGTHQYRLCIYRLDVFTDYFDQGNNLTQRLSDIVERQVWHPVQGILEKELEWIEKENVLPPRPKPLLEGYH